MSEKTKGAIKNGQSRDTGDIRHKKQNEYEYPLSKTKTKTKNKTKQIKTNQNKIKQTNKQTNK